MWNFNTSFLQRLAFFFLVVTNLSRRCEMIDLIYLKPVESLSFGYQSQNNEDIQLYWDFLSNLYNS